VPFAETGGGSALLVSKVNQRAPSLSTLRPDLDKRLADWVDHLLERDPRRRPGGAATVAETLEDMADDALGPRWRREAALPSGQPAPVVREPTQTLRTLELARRLLAKALTRPLNLLVPACVIVAGVFLASWLFLVAALTYLVLVLISYFDEAEAHRAAAAGRSSGRT
jgi:hypothetical protein